MTDQQHPVTPPPELRQLWAQQAQRMDPRDPVAWQEHVATQAARWGSDQELEACCEWLINHNWRSVEPALRAARRPKPPSLKEQSLALLDKIQGSKAASDISDLNVVRRALEALDD